MAKQSLLSNTILGPSMPVVRAYFPLLEERLTNVAFRFGITMDALVKWNRHWQNFMHAEPGHVLLIPNPYLGLRWPDPIQHAAWEALPAWNMRDGQPTLDNPARIALNPDFNPARPSFNAVGGQAQAQAKFGRFEWEDAPLPNNPENIRIKGNWVAQNIKYVPIPQLKKMWEPFPSASLPFHTDYVEQFKQVWERWDREGLMDQVVNCAGAWVARYQRGSRTALSNHAWGTAFDINAKWNGLGKEPAKIGYYGCVRELVAIAHDCGFFWGGHFSKRKDGMHFEIAVKR